VERVAADQASTKDQPTNSAIARYAKAVTQPGGMNIDWPKVGAAGDVIVGLTAIRGLRHRKWQYVHNFGVALGFVAVAAALLKKKYGEAPRPSSGRQ
jgi:hypothetical protein